MNELTSQRNSLMEELVQLRRHADDNGRKLAHVNAVITEQEVINSIHYTSRRRVFNNDNNTKRNFILGMKRKRT
ncbi:hypothetical protein X777_04679 [Ooceraea biroi]|uniref:Uncharacterized protein n=1 Tax=Ooceraea biroi TaxID=2015173 RepID=A0A026X198_OOCBI|nr:hypothetical protein X777_04679 [Ooceraea biroi]